MTRTPERRSAIASWVDRRFFHLMTLPSLAALAGLILFPLLYTLWLSVHEWVVTSGRPPAFAGFANYARLSTDPNLWAAIWRTLIFVGVGLAVQIPVGLGIALALQRRFVGRGLARTLMLLPMMATPAAVSLIWAMMMEPTLGILNHLLMWAGLPAFSWISDPSTVMLSLILVDTWQWSPLIALFCLAGLAVIPDEPYEAARIDGASGWQELRYVTLPYLRPIIVVAAMFRAIDSLKTFDMIYVMTQGGPGRSSETINMFAFTQGFHYFNMGYASAVLVLFLAIMLVVSLALISVRERRSSVAA